MARPYAQVLSLRHSFPSYLRYKHLFNRRYSFLKKGKIIAQIAMINKATENLASLITEPLMKCRQ